MASSSTPPIIKIEEILNLVKSYLNDFNNKEIVDNLTSSIINLITLNNNQNNSIIKTTNLSLNLYKILNSLILPILNNSNNNNNLTLPDLSNYFINSLYSNLNSTNNNNNLTILLSDSLIDVIWQLDQDLDSGLINYLLLPNVSQSKSVEIEGIEVFETEEIKQKLQLNLINKLEKEARLKLTELVKRLTTAGVLSTQDCLERFELTFLASPNLTLIQDATTFNRAEIRSRTALFYKQQKFNLLREESEGYSKLIVEILTNMGPPHSTLTGRSIESLNDRKKRAKLVGDSIKSLIGNFDLDPDRTLDIILDTFSEQLVQHHQFFIDLLLASPWAPKIKSTTTTKDQMNVDEDIKGKSKAPIIDVGLENDSGSFLISQILGFKFAYYQEARVEKAPEKIYLMTALLIWHGFVKISDIWPHLSPDDSILTAMDGKYRDEQSKLASSVGGSNALASAGALLDDDPPIRPTPSSSSTTSAAAKKAAAATASVPNTPIELPNQKIFLLKALLSIGDLNHSLFILTQFPHLISIQLEISDLLIRLLNVSVESAYEVISLKFNKKEFMNDFTSPKKVFVATSSSTSSSTTTTATTLAPGTTTTTTTNMPPPTTLPTKPKPIIQPPIYLSGRPFNPPPRQYTFFFSEWKEKLPKPTEYDEILVVLELYLPFLSVFISRDFSLFTKVCRIARNDIQYSRDTVRTSRWLELFRLYLLPGISLLENHSVASIEIWKVLELFPLETRYKLYGEWKDVMYRKIPVLSVRKAETERDIKNVLRRLSTDSVKNLGKIFSRLSSTNPCIIFTITLNQVQSYDNLILPVVEAARYLSDLGFDIFTFSLLDALCCGKNKTKDDGTSVALWLQGLATFVGQFYRRWPNTESSLWVILQYLVNQLVAGNSKDLVVLTELIGKMTGLEPFADLSNLQVMSLSGGNTLRSEVFNRTDLNNASHKFKFVRVVTEKAKERLVKSLRISGLAMPLLVNVAIQLQACVSDTEAHLKSLGGLFDQCRAALFQYMEFLSISFDQDELANMVPDVVTLMGKYGIHCAVAFDIARPKLQLAIRAFEEKDKAADAKRKAEVTARLAQAKASGSSTTTTPTIIPSTTSSESIKMETSIKVEGSSTPSSINDDVIMVDTSSASPAVKVAPTSIWNPGLVDVIQSMDTILPETVISHMGSAFFVTFWQLTLHDIHCPKDRYDAESSRMLALSKEANSSTLLTSNEKSAFSSGVMKLAKELTNELTKHSSLRAATNRRLTREKSSWFSNVTTREQHRHLLDQLVQYCIQPRAKSSLIDAVYTHQMMKKMHMMNTTSFHTLRIYQAILGEQLGPILFSCTENEARNYAQFLHDLLRDVSRWYKDPALYQSEFIGTGLVGALVNITDVGTKTITSDSYVPHHKYLNLVIKWSINMLAAFENGFASGEYMNIKNSILVLTKLAPFYPIQYKEGAKLEHAISELLKVETREDLKILAQGYKAILGKRRDHWLDQPPAPPKAESKADIKKDIKVESRPPSTPATPLRNGQTTSTSSSSSSAIPVGPKHTLPIRPGQNGNSTPTSRPDIGSRRTSEGEIKSNAMDVDSPATSTSTASASQSRSTLREPSGPPPKMHSSLPTRPNEKSSGTSSPNPDILRQQVIDSQRSRAPGAAAAAAAASAANMNPPSALSTSNNTSTSTTTTSRKDSKDASPRDSKRELNTSTTSTTASTSKSSLNESTRPSSSSTNDNRSSNNNDTRSSTTSDGRPLRGDSSSRDPKDLNSSSSRTSLRHSRERTPTERDSKNSRDDRDHRDNRDKSRRSDDRDKDKGYGEDRRRRSDRERREDGEVDSRSKYSDSRDSQRSTYDQKKDSDVSSTRDSRGSDRDKGRDSGYNRDSKDKDKGRNDSSYTKRSNDNSRSSQPPSTSSQNLPRNNPNLNTERRVDATSTNPSNDRLRPPPSARTADAKSPTTSTSTTATPSINIQSSSNSTSNNNPPPSSRMTTTNSNNSDGSNPNANKLGFSIRGRSSDAGSKMMKDAVHSASGGNSNRRPSSSNKDNDKEKERERYYSGDRDRDRDNDRVRERDDGGKKRGADLLDRLGGGDNNKNDNQDNKRPRNNNSRDH